MPVLTVELSAQEQTSRKPILWRVGKLFSVVTNILRARVTQDAAHVSLQLEGSTAELEQAQNYLRGLGVLAGEPAGGFVSPGDPEELIPQANTIYVRISTVTREQARYPLLYRVGKDFDVIVNIARASFDEADGGFVEVTLTGTLQDVQRCIAFLHTTGFHINPRQRSVTDLGNL